MDALVGADIPEYSSIIFRRTLQDLKLRGALLDRAATWLRPTAAVWSAGDYKWTFPSGAVLQFGYCEKDNDVYRYASAEFHRLGVDELTQFSEKQYRFLRTRLRRTLGFPIRPHSRAASNPGGRGHSWVKARYVDPKTATYPFIPSFIKDNPSIDQADYTTRLEDLDATTRAQLLEGLWVDDSQGLIYPITAANFIDYPPDFGDREQWSYVLGVDLGASDLKETTAYCVVGWHKKLPGDFVLWSDSTSGDSPSDIAEMIKALSVEYGGFVQIVVDEGALGKGYGKEFRIRHKIPTLPAEKKSKPGYRRLCRGALQRRRIMVVQPANEKLIKEASELVYNEAGLDNEKGAANHLTDALLYAWKASKAFAARPPDQRPAAGSREALEAEMAAIEAEEVKSVLREEENARRGRRFRRRR